MTSDRNENAQDVPTQIFKEFIAALGDVGIPSEIVARLSKALLEERTFGEGALKAALISEAPPL